MKKRTSRNAKLKPISQILKENNQGIRLDIGCSGHKHPGFVGLDIRAEKGVDIVHNLEQFPYPLPDNSCSQIIASHVLEHMNPASPDPRLVGLIDLLIEKKVITKAQAFKKFGEHHVFGTFMTMMDEMWRILKPGGQLAFVVPYAGSPGYWQDPTHINPINEATPMYFDPEHQSNLWTVYKPKPWKIEMTTWNANLLEVVMSKRDIAPYEESIKIGTTSEA